MATANNCNIPENLYYWVNEHVWVRPESDGTLTIGMTDAAQHLAGSVVNATPKAAGKSIKKGRSTGTVESGKWVGPIKSPVDGTIVAVNGLLSSDPKVLNRDPYGDGWFIRVQPTDWETEKSDLLTGEEAITAYDAFLKEQGIDCGGSGGSN